MYLNLYSKVIRYSKIIALPIQHSLMSNCTPQMFQTGCSQTEFKHIPTTQSAHTDSFTTVQPKGPNANYKQTRDPDLRFAFNLVGETQTQVS